MNSGVNPAPRLRMLMGRMTHARDLLQMTTGMMVALTVSGCITGMFSGPTVVERSKEQRPAWVDLATGKFHRTDGMMQFHDVRTKLPDLPIGIKSTQIQTLEASERALQADLRSNLDRLAKDAKLGEITATGELDEVVIAEVKKFHGANMKVADLYYEKVAGESGSNAAAATPDAMTSWYTAHVLVQFPAARYTDLLTDTGKSLQRAKDPTLRKLGVAASGAAAGFSH